MYFILGLYTIVLGIIYVYFAFLACLDLLSSSNICGLEVTILPVVIMIMGTVAALRFAMGWLVLKRLMRNLWFYLLLTLVFLIELLLGIIYWYRLLLDAGVSGKILLGLFIFYYVYIAVFILTKKLKTASS